MASPAPARSGAPLLEVKGVSKSFPGVKALSDMHLDVAAGEVLGLVGENGAGKSTLMKVLSGLYHKDSGTISMEGTPVEIRNPSDAHHLGISIIHQELHLMPDLTVAENIYIGREKRSMFGLLVDDKDMNRRAGELLRELGIALDPRARVGGLTVAQQQMVEIAKALSVSARVLIMDEPTAALTAAETTILFRLIEDLKQKGTAIVYISHRMEELQAITDRITVIRDGEYVDTLPTADADMRQVISLMVGRRIEGETRPAETAGDRPVVLSVQGLSTRRLLRDVSFELHEGEILGFAGLMGAGRTEVARAIVGADPMTSGEIRVHGEQVHISNPADAARHRIGYLSEDRKRFGLLLDQDVNFNVLLPSLGDYVNPIGLVRAEPGRRTSEKYVKSMRIKTPSIRQRAGNLSGGNQQKIVISKWLAKDCDILIFDEPTRGIDVGAKEEIYTLLNDLAGQGKSIIMISSELPEVLRLSHRIVVMSAGRVTGVLENSEADQEVIMERATQFDAAQEGVAQ